jgi:hypothetical protein
MLTEEFDVSRVVQKRGGKCGNLMSAGWFKKGEGSVDSDEKRRSLHRCKVKITSLNSHFPRI